MESADLGQGNDAPLLGWLDGARLGSIFLEREMRARAAIDDYVPFSAPVAAKLPDGTFFEQMEHQNFWGVGVREIPLAVYERILTEAGIVPRTASPVPAPEPDDLAPKLPDMADVTPTFTTDSTAVLKPQVTTSIGDEGVARRSGRRRTKHGKVIGDRAEAIVHAALQKDGVNGLRWLANEGEKPGWDIEYIGGDGRLIAVEVKGTTGSAFASFEMTDCEFLARIARTAPPGAYS